MGRVARHKKVKAIDPHAPRRTRNAATATATATDAAARRPADAPAPELEDRLPKRLARLIKFKATVERLNSGAKKGKGKGKGNDGGGSSNSSSKSNDGSSGSGSSKTPNNNNNNKTPNNNNAVPTSLPTIRDGESVRAYHERVDAVSAQILQAKVKATHTISARRKEYLKQRKLKKQGAARPRVDPSDERLHEREQIKFGEVAQDIPHFTALPKTRTARDRPAPAPASRGDDDKDADDAEDKAPERSAADKRILDVERTRVIAVYRELKKRKQQEHDLREQRRAHRRQADE